MDILREDLARDRRRRRIILAVVGTAAALLITLGLSRLKPAAPTVDRSTVWIDVVKKGPMVRQVRGPGSLVPETDGIRQISASTDARIERLRVQPGSQVAADTVLLDMSNPELERDALDASWQLKAGQAELVNTRVRLQKELLDQQAAAATVESDYHQADLQAQTNEGLAKEGIVADITLKLSRVRAEELATRNGIEKKRLSVYSESAQAQLAAQEARVEQLRALARLKASQVEALHVRAGIAGVLQELPVQPGQRVTSGTTLAKVVQPDKLKAQLKIAETQARRATGRNRFDRHPQRRRLRPRVAGGPIGAGRHGHCRRRTGRAVAQGRATGSVCRRHDRAGEIGRRRLGGQAGLRTGRRSDHSLPPRPGRRRSRSREDPAGKELRQHGSDSGRRAAGGSRDPLRHERLGCVRPGEAEVKDEFSVISFQLSVSPSSEMELKTENSELKTAATEERT